MTTTTTVSLGWTGEPDASSAHRRCKSIVKRTNKLLQRHNLPAVSLEPMSVTLNITCPFQLRYIVAKVAGDIKDARDNIRQTEKELDEYLSSISYP